MSTSTLIASGTRLTGEISGDGDLTVAGLVDGTVDLEDSLTVASDGFVQGDVRAGVVTVEGAVDGTIEGTERVVLAESARVTADIETPNLIVDEGAQFSGDIEVVEGDGDASSRRSRRSSRSGRRRTSSTTRSSTKTSSSSRSSSPTRSTSSETRSSSSDSSVGKTSSEDSSRSDASSDPSTDTSDDEETSDSAQAEAAEAAEASDTDDALAEMEASEIADSYTVRELRDELRKRDLTVRGKKSTLVKRLVDKAGLGDTGDEDDTSED